MKTKMKIRTNYTTTIRRNNRTNQDCVASWVTMPDGQPYNIWDIPVYQYNETIENALKSAFERGVLFAKMSMKNSLEKI